MSVSLDLISGATGFIGGRLREHLVQIGQPSYMLARTPLDRDHVRIADLADPIALTAACAGIKRVFHCAGYAHAFAARTDDDADQHWRVNFAGTRNLVEAAGRAGVQRFVFLSSVKAMAEPGLACADEDFTGRPPTVYGLSKRAAEEAVLAGGNRFGMHVAVLRLTMVYGSGGRGNLERMGRLVRRRLFPPLPETGNHRSLVHIKDVVAAMCLAADDDRARGRTYIVAGPQAPSGRQLFDAMRKVLELPECRWAVPQSAFRLGALCGEGLEAILRRRMPLDIEALDRLLGSAWYSPKRIERELGWSAKITLEEGLREMFGR